MGGVFGTVIGYGIGHAMQGRWIKTGWIHTTFQVSGLAILIGGYIGLFPAFSAKTSYIIGSVVFVGSKIWEIVDLWNVPSSMKVVSQKGLYMAPTLYSQYNQDRFLGIKLQYNF